MAEEVEQTEAEAKYIDPDELERTEAELVRWKRDDLLSRCDWWGASDPTMSQAQSDYRQSLRNIPQQEGFPFAITWPTKP